MLGTAVGTLDGFTLEEVVGVIVGENGAKLDILDGFILGAIVGF